MTNTEKWMSQIVGFVAAYRRPSDGRVLAAHLKTLVPGTEEHWKFLNVGRKDVEGLIAEIGRGRTGKDGEPTRQYASKLASLYLKMRPNLTKFWASRLINEEQNKLAKPAVALLKFDPDMAAKKELALDKQLHQIKDRLIRRLFINSAKTLPKQSKHLDEINVLVKAWTGKPGLKLTPDQEKKIKEKDPERFKRYKKLHLDANEAWKAVVRNAVRSAGKPLPIKDVVAALDAAGVTEKHPYRLFLKSPLLVGEDTLLRTSKGKFIKVLPPLGSEFLYNKRYDPAKDNMYVFQYRPPNTIMAPGKWKQVYTRSFALGRKEARFDAILKDIDTVPKYRAKWVADLKSKDPAKSTLGAIVECLYEQAARIGGKGSTKGQETYGFTTVKVGVHVKKAGDKFVIAYQGKDAIMQKHVISSRVPEAIHLLKVMNRLMKGKQRGDRFWTINGSPVGAGHVRAYLKSLGVKLSPHKFRHVRGTKLMQKKLAEAKIPAGANQQQVEKIVRGLAIDVGALLGHVSGTKTTAATAIKSYIAPQVFTQFFDDRGLRVPQWVPKFKADE